MTPLSFLFAVVRDVQRNTAAQIADQERSFYSLSCETYSGTRRSRSPSPRLTAFLFAVVRDVQRNAVAERLRSIPQAAFLFAVVRDVQRNKTGKPLLDKDGKFLFAVVRDVQRNTIAIHLGGRVVFLFAVVRDVQRNVPGSYSASLGGCGFYSLSCETYSGTSRTRIRSPMSGLVSIRCRARRTAEPSASHPSATGSLCFYSLSCETYSGTGRVRRRGDRRIETFLFAVVRDVQRNISWHTVTTPSGSFLFAVVRDVQRNWTSKSVIGHKEWTSQVSIRCRARRTAELGSPAGLGCRDEFLFAVVRDVQRNLSVTGTKGIGPPTGFYSLSCETYSGTHRCAATRRWLRGRRLQVSIRCRARRTAEHPRGWSTADPVGDVSIRCRARRTAERRSRRPRPRPAPRRVSIRCRARRTAELQAGDGEVTLAEFLFAVVRDVQRNALVKDNIYFVEVSIRCRARRTAELDTANAKSTAETQTFLFAVVRDVQRNERA